MKSDLKTAICIAGGPSLTQEDVNYCRGKGKVYVVKEGALIAPWADVLYAADTDWWTQNEQRWKPFQGDKFTVSDRACMLYPELKHVKAKTQQKWSETPGEIATGGNSGFQIINLAELDQEFKPDQIILLGYDYGYDEHKENKHWWDEKHPRHSRYSNYAQWVKRMRDAAPLIKTPIINATPKTAIDCFPKKDLRSIL